MEEYFGKFWLLANKLVHLRGKLILKTQLILSLLSFTDHLPQQCKKTTMHLIDDCP